MPFEILKQARHLRVLLVAGLPGFISGGALLLISPIGFAPKAEAQLPLDTRIIYLGDSITADPSMSSYALWGLWDSGGRCYPVWGWNQGVGGNTSANMLARINATTSRINPGKTIVVVLGGANSDVSPPDPTVTSGYLRTIYNCIEAAGGKVVGVPTTPFATGSSSYQTALDQFVASQPDITAVNISGFNPATMLQDNVHPNMLGGYYLGGQVAAAVNSLITTSGELNVTANNLHPNPTFAGTNVGSGPNWSGTYCNGLTISVSGTNGTPSASSWTLSKATMTADGRPAQQCRVTNSPEENTITLSFNCPINGNIGDLFEGWCEVEVTGTGLMGFYLNHAGGIEVPAWQGWWARPCIAPSGPVVLRTSPSALYAETSTAPWTLGVDVAPGATLTFRVAAAMSRKVPDLAASAPSITSTSTDTATLNTPFSYQITATNSPTSYIAAGLPSGLSVNTSNGAIAGTPTTSGTDYVTMMAINSSGTGVGTLTLVVNSFPAGAPVINSSSTAAGTVNDAFSYQITATNSPTSYNATGLPSNLSVNTSTGVISGTPTVSGSSSVTLSAINSSGTGTATLALTVNPLAGSSLVANGSFETPSLPASTYEYNPAGSSWAWGPNYAGIESNGSPYGAPNAPDGTQAAVLECPYGVSGTMSQIINVPAAGQYTVSFQAAGRSNYGNGALPFDVTMDGAVLGTFTPGSLTAFNTYTTSAFTISSTGSHVLAFVGHNVTTDQTSFIDLVAMQPVSSGNDPVITSASTATGTAGSAFSYQITATDSPTSYNATGLPSGVSVNTSTGAITGTPDTFGVYTVALSGINSSGTGTATLTLTVNFPEAGSFITIANNSFETPSIIGYADYPGGSSWTWGGSAYAGIEHNGSAYGAPNAPDGTQAAFLECPYGTAGTMSQTVNVPAAGEYTVSFQAAGRSNYGNGALPFDVEIDGSMVGTFTPASLTAFDSYTTSPFTISTAGNHTLAFVGHNVAVDQSSFIDLVTMHTAITPFAAWQDGWFTTAQIADQSISGETASPAGDGIPNLMKYALGLNPNVAYNGMSPGLPYFATETSGSNRYLSLTFTGTAQDVSYNVQASSDLMSWSTLYNSTPGEAPGAVTVSDTDPILTTRQRFIRLQINSAY